MINKRASGVLLHITSLPSAHGIGDLGPEAYHFANLLAIAKQGYWQILPLTPIDEGLGNSPYSSMSAFAGNTLLISLEKLVDEGFLLVEEIQDVPSFPTSRIAYPLVRAFKEPLLTKAFQRFANERRDTYAYEQFCQEHQHWLDDYALFIAVNKHLEIFNWSEWPASIRDRTPAGITEYSHLLREEIYKEKFFQWLFYKQWFSLKQYCAERGVQFIGDLPIYVNFHSADVWANSQCFKLDKQKKPYVVAGVPPDYFSADGQLWGNPVYDWKHLQETGYGWWLQRLSHNIHLFNLVRLDHFLGFVSYWEVKAGEKTAKNGTWVDAPADDFFAALFRQSPYLPIIAEDLGIVTPQVREFMQKNGFPGMKVLLFAFGDDMPTNPYIVHNHVENCFVYTGTHDNNTVRGWFRKDASEDDRQRLENYLGQTVEENLVSLQLMRLAMQSVGRVAITPVQDILGLDETARVNTPGIGEGNWAWRLTSGQFTEPTAALLGEITKMYGRA
jgi:4-alpha-glucanotransferase